MTTLAHDCAMLGIAAETGRLYDGDDPNYEIWLDLVRHRVADTRRSIARQQERKSKPKGK